MTKRKVWIGPFGPFPYKDDSQYYDDDGEPSGITRRGLRAEPNIYLESAPATANEAVRLTDLTSTIASLRYATTFNDGSLSNGILTVTHNLGEQYVIIAVYDNNAKIIYPDDITVVDTNSLTVDLSSFGTLSGIWRVVIKK